MTTREATVSRLDARAPGVLDAPGAPGEEPAAVSA